MTLNIGCSTSCVSTSTSKQAAVLTQVDTEECQAMGVANRQGMKVLDLKVKGPMMERSSLQEANNTFKGTSPTLTR